jgi:hypothetical protein
VVVAAAIFVVMIADRALDLMEQKGERRTFNSGDDSCLHGVEFL